MNQIFTYSDFRTYLKDFYSSRKESAKDFSYRTFAKEMGFPSPNHLNLVMAGKRDIGIKSLSRLIDRLPLKNDSEKDYFNYLVFFCQSNSPVQKNYYYGLMAGLQKPQKIRKLLDKHYDYYSEWYHPVVRELVARESGAPDYERIASRIQPRISAAKVKKSVELLLELGMIIKRGDGGYALKSQFIGTDREVSSLVIRNYHHAMMDKARESIDTVPRDRREISSVTVCVSPDVARRIKERIQTFEDEILEMARSSTGSSMVYQLNFQYFPHTVEEKQ